MSEKKTFHINCSEPAQIKLIHQVDAKNSKKFCQITTWNLKVAFNQKYREIVASPIKLIHQVDAKNTKNSVKSQPGISVSHSDRIFED